MLERISVVYPTCGRPDFLVRSITALLQNELLPDEILVVDQSRGAETGQALAAFGNARIVHLPSDERGLSRARNLGIRSSRFPVLGFIDDDCIPARDWVLRAAELIRDQQDVGVWIGPMVYEERLLAQPARPTTVKLDGVFDPWRYDPSGGNCFYRRTVFEALGPYDPLLGQGSNFPGAEDGDMLYRMLRARVGATYTDTVRVFHLPWRGPVEKLNNRYNYGCGAGAMLAKYFKPRDLPSMTNIFARHFLKKFLLAPYYRVFGPRREYEMNATYARGLVDGFLGWRRLHAGGE
jgi:glycosyltransferase involved in cell wall biosynthesis